MKFAALILLLALAALTGCKSNYNVIEQGAVKPAAAAPAQGAVAHTPATLKLTWNPNWHFADFPNEADFVVQSSNLINWAVIFVGVTNQLIVSAAAPQMFYKVGVTNL